MQSTLVSLIAAIGLFTVGCGSEKHDHHHDHAGHGHGAKGHGHEPPHGGAPVVLGDEAFHLEFVRDGETATLTAYVLDGHMENFVRVTNASLLISVQGHDALELKAVANSATGETAGDTSQFAGQAEWLKTTTNFVAGIPTIGLRGQIFTNVSFSFPKGNE